MAEADPRASPASASAWWSCASCRAGCCNSGWGGDTLNTAVYLARLGLSVDYVTALGDDAWSGEMLASWAAEGVGTGLVQRLPGRLPGAVRDPD